MAVGMMKRRPTRGKRTRSAGSPSTWRTNCSRFSGIQVLLMSGRVATVARRWIGQVLGQRGPQSASWSSSSMGNERDCFFLTVRASFGCESPLPWPASSPSAGTLRFVPARLLRGVSRATTLVGGVEEGSLGEAAFFPSD